MITADIITVFHFVGLPEGQNEAGAQHLLERHAGLFENISVKSSKTLRKFYHNSYGGQTGGRVLAMIGIRRLGLKNIHHLKKCSENDMHGGEQIVAFERLWSF